jgi:hypothetical protein
MLFDNEGSYNGHRRWARLSFRSGQILSNRGALRRSIAPHNPKGSPAADGIVRFTGDEIIVGTKLLYARMMNDGTTKMPGGVLRPKNAKALKIPVPQGKNAGPAAKGIQAQALGPRIARAHERALKHAARNPHSKVTQRSYETWTRLMAKAKEGKGGGVKFIFVKSVRIPPRNFTDWNAQDQAEVDGAFLSKLAEIANG